MTYNIDSTILLTCLLGATPSHDEVIPETDQQKSGM